MTDLEELKRNREKLVLERDIARLTRHKRIADWSYLWVAPIAIFGVVLFFSGVESPALDSFPPALMFMGALLVAPLALKIFMNLRS